MSVNLILKIPLVTLLEIKLSQYRSQNRRVEVWEVNIVGRELGKLHRLLIQAVLMNRKGEILDILGKTI